VIFIQPGPGNKRTLIETGDNLGQMQSELKENEIIVEVVCAGPENYAYKTYNSETGESKTVCKVRGITLNFAKKKEMLSKKDDETVIVHTKNKIKRKKIDAGVHLISPRTRRIVSFLKRRRLNDNTSLPFGYISEK